MASLIDQSNWKLCECILNDYSIDKTNQNVSAKVAGCCLNLTNINYVQYVNNKNCIRTFNLVKYGAYMFHYMLFFIMCYIHYLLLCVTCVISHFNVILHSLFVIYKGYNYILIIRFNIRLIIIY